MKAQRLYDLREEFEFCSGKDLHEFFRETVGEPSPSGRAEIDRVAAESFVDDSVARCIANSPPLAWEMMKAQEEIRKP